MGIIFRRYRRTSDGQVLDAHAYGYRAWAMDVDDSDESGNTATPIGHGGPGPGNLKSNDSDKGNDRRKN